MTITAVDGGYTCMSAQSVGEPAFTADDGPRPEGDPSRPDAWRDLDAWHGLLVVVTGTRGAGSSLLAMGLAADLAEDASNRGLVLLADLVPGSGQDIEAERHEPPVMVARARVRDEDELEGFLGTHRFVVADVAADIDASVEANIETGVETGAGRILGTQPAGVADIAPLAQAALRRAHLIVVVADADSLRSLAQTVEGLAAQAGAERILPVVNRLPRSFKRRSAVAAEAVRLLAGSAALEAGDPVFITERSSIRRAVRDGRTLPSWPFRPLGAEVRIRLAAAPLGDGRRPAIGSRQRVASEV